MTDNSVSSKKLFYQKIDIYYILALATSILLIFWKLTLLKEVPNIGDNFIYMIPIRALVANALKSGIIPFWTPYFGMGYPVFLDPFVSTFHPIDFFLNKYLPLGAAFNYSLIIDLILIAVFTYLFTRSIGISCGGSFIAGMSFTMCGWILGFLGGVQNIHALPWLPAMLWLTELYYKKRNPCFLGLLVMVISMAILSMFPQILLYSLYTFFGYFLWRSVHSRGVGSITVRYLALWLILVIGALTICSVWLLPALEYMKYSVRSNGLSYSLLTIGSYNPLFLFTLVFPILFLGPHGHIGQYVNIYLGIFPLLFALIAVFSPGKERKFIQFFVVTGILAFIFALGSYNPLFPLLVKFPGLSFFRNHSRFLFLTEFSLAVLAGFGFDKFINPMCKKWPRFLSVFLASSLVALFLMAVLKISGYAFPFSSKLAIAFKGITPQALLVPLFTILAGTSVVVLWRRGKIPRSLCKIMVLGLVSVDLFLFAHYGRSLDYPSMQTLTRKPESVQYLMKDQSLYRIYSIPFRDEADSSELYSSGKNYYVDFAGLLISPINVLFRLSSPAVANCTATKPIYELNRALEGDDCEAHLYNPLTVNRVERLSKLLGFLNVKFVLSKENINSPNYELVKGGIYKIYRNHEFLPRAIVFSQFGRKNAPLVPESVAEAGRDGLRLSSYVDSNPQGKLRMATITSYDSTQVEIKLRSDKDGYLLLTDAMYPGWQAWVDGKQADIIISDYVFRAVRIEKGVHSVKFGFQSKSYFLGLKVSLLGAFTLLIIVTAAYISKEGGLWKRIKKTT